MRTPIDFHHEPNRRSEEINDEAPPEDDLPLEADPGGTRAKHRPELLLGRSGSGAHGASASDEDE